MTSGVAKERAGESPRRHLSVCTCGIVVAEVFQGLRRNQGRDTIRHSFDDMTFLGAGEPNRCAVSSTAEPRHSPCLRPA